MPCQGCVAYLEDFYEEVIDASSGICALTGQRSRCGPGVGWYNDGCQIGVEEPVIKTIGLMPTHDRVSILESEVKSLRQDVNRLLHFINMRFNWHLP